ncbi:MAG: hypothetical protein AAF291_06335 [Pseudomonadota bacterium]
MRVSDCLAAALLAGLSLAALSACDDAAGDANPPGAVSEGEAAALDEAAKMLDDQRLPQGALPDVDPPAPAPETRPATPEPTR